MKLQFTILSGLMLLSACATTDGPPASFDLDLDEIVDATPANEPLSRYGNPPSYEVAGKTYQVMKSNKNFVQKGEASWYGTKFHGRRTSSGEPYDMYAMTAAHKRLPLPTYVEVTHLENGRKVIVKVNDRGPFHEGRIIDLSYAAARKLGIAGTGTGPVEIRAISTGNMDLDTSSVVLPEASRGDGRIHVQVAAYGVSDSAERVAGDLRNKNFNSVRVHVIESDGKKLYRVRIGPIPNIDLAYRVLKNLNDIGLQSARVVVD
ncbi:MAG: septal ring lytic transglycosylase RlpA family protein [Gammaproteobacteria bacterium]|nr:septal ring lytic transglycosylase RlpA family protein [Gammaproteobacteria bacterium]